MLPLLCKDEERWRRRRREGVLGSIDGRTEGVRGVAKGEEQREKLVDHFFPSFI